MGAARYVSGETAVALGRLGRRTIFHACDWAMKAAATRCKDGRRQRESLRLAPRERVVRAEGRQQKTKLVKRLARSGRTPVSALVTQQLLKSFESGTGATRLGGEAAARCGAGSSCGGEGCQ
mmetsp:Transcript_13364/g.49655  ORF Transcript_13364/g.49655 Transcript_13364/m.49655 type:complete len:122 (-) Transcript_13364:278-643(-)